ncbi:MAG: NAD(P)/FAD-dependent oxidoreductase [Promethearchaeota archaeon]
MMFDIIIIGSGISGASFAYKMSKYAKILLIEAKDKKSFPISTNLFPEHNLPFLKDINYTDKDIFPCIHQKLNYMGKEHNGIIDSKEFGAPFGYICYFENLIEYMLFKFEDKGGIIKDGEKVLKILRSNQNIEVITNKGQSYSGKLLVIATGSHGFDLQRSLGFSTPDTYKWVYTHLYGDEDKLNENMDFDYIFHLNPKISQCGPFFINKGLERILAGFLIKEEDSQDQNIAKLDRILNNYKLIQPFVRGLKRGTVNTIVAEISKHPIKTFSKERIIILGEAAGLVSAFFYEGILGGLASSNIAFKVIKPLLEEKNKFTKSELNKYDQEIYRILLKNYFKTQKASEILFYNSGSKMNTLWETYAEFIKTNQTIRKYIWEAFRNQNLENHNTDRDKWAGEQLFKRLPLLAKATYWPHFLNANL